MNVIRASRVAAVAGVGLLFLAAAVQKLWSADTWTLLAIGRWVVEHRGWPRVEEWTWSGAGQDWVELRWLFCVPLFLLYERAGEWAPSVMGAGLVAATFSAAAWGSRFVLRTPAGLAIVALGLVAGLTRWVVRPELVTYATVGVFLAALDGTSRPAKPRGGAWWTLAPWWLIPLQMVWTNAHGMFIFGPVLAWTFAGSAVLRQAYGWLGGRSNTADERAAAPGAFRMGLLAAAITGACWINPYGMRGAMMPWVLLSETRGVLSAHIEELRGMFAAPWREWRPDTWAMLVLVAAALGAGAVRWRRLDAARVAILGMIVYLACAAQRNAGLVAVMGTWAGLRSLDAAAQHPPRIAEDPAPAGSRPGAGVVIGFVAIGLLCAAAAWYLASDRYWRLVGSRREWGTGVVPGMTAHGAADFVVAAGVQGRIYNGFGDGGYLIWRRVLPVYVDGRTEVHEPAFWSEYFEGGRGTWSQWADQQGVNTAILPRRGYEWLESGLSRLPGWALVYMDERDTIFVRQTEAHAALIRRCRIDPSALRTGRPPAP